MKDLQHALESFRSTARTLQVEWAQESPYIPGEEEEHNTPMAPFVENDSAPSRKSAACPAASADSSPPLIPPASPNVTASVRPPHKLFPNVDIDSIKGPLPPRTPTSTYCAPTTDHPQASPPYVSTAAHGHQQSQSRYDSPEYQLSRLRSDSTTVQLKGHSRKQVISFYKLFVDFLNNYRVPICLFEDITLEKLEDLSEHVYPADIDPTSYYHGRYSTAIYTRLEDPGVHHKVV